MRVRGAFPMFPMEADEDERTAAPIAPDIEAEALRDALALWRQEHAFEVGQVVRLKPGLARYNFPPGVLFVIGELFDEPIFDTTHELIEVRMEPLHGVIWFRRPDGAQPLVVCLGFFEPVPEADLAPP
jgi:hypothetical protein